MGKKIITLTESELKEMIYNAVLPILNEIGAKTYAIVHQATNRAKQNNQQGNYIHQINATKQKTNDDIISKLNDEKKDGFLSFSWRTAGRLLGLEIIF